MSRRIIGITGGIGSGKSVASRILRLQGRRVFDCDYEAKLLMDTSAEIKQRICAEISSDVTDGSCSIDRRRLAEIVFSEPEMLAKLNAIVHGEVAREMLRVAGEADDILFVEAAILASSGLAEYCDRIWIVECRNKREKMERVMQRNGCDSAEVERRMEAQKGEEELLRKYSERVEVIYNESDIALLPQINVLTQQINNIDS